MADTKKLDKIIDFDGASYEVQAVYSDEAGHAESADTSISSNITEQLQNKLQFVAVNPSGKESTIEFNGKESKEIKYVPASGGRFNGPVLVENKYTDLSKVDNLGLLNCGQIKTMVEQLTGHPLYIWDGTSLTGQTTLNGTTLQTVSLIIGESAEYSKLISSTKQPEAFLYICKDEDRSIYLKTPGTTPIKLSIGAEHLNGTDKDYAITDIDEKFESLHGVIAQNSGNIASNTSNIGALTAEITKIKNGTSTVKKAESATSATSATKATQDANGNVIINNYYRSTYNTSAANSITITDDTQTPTGGVNGDIWIVYKSK